MADPLSPLPKFYWESDFLRRPLTDDEKNLIEYHEREHARFYRDQMRQHGVSQDEVNRFNREVDERIRRVIAGESLQGLPPLRSAFSKN